MINFLIEYVLLLPMKIVNYDEVDDTELTELMLACFGHTYSKRHIENMVASDRRMPEWGGELYALNGDDLMGCVGILYPKVNIGDELITVGGIRNVCSRPSQSNKGVVKELLRRAHEIMEERVDISFLMTSGSNVAFNLYNKMDYRTIFLPPKVYKRIEGETRKTDVELRDESAPEYVRSTYMDSLEGLKGFTYREKDFWEMAEARGWPDNDEIKIAYKGDKRIGYVMMDEGRNSLSIKEIAAKNSDLSEILQELEHICPQEFLVISHANPNYRAFFRESGYTWHDDLWYRVMIKDLKGGSEGYSKLFDKKDSFHAGLYEVY